MVDLECPSCHQKTIPLWRKMCLGPAAHMTCAGCGSRISVPYTSMLAVIPFVIAIGASRAVGSFGVATIVLVGGIAAMCWIHYQFVPLIVKK